MNAPPQRSRLATIAMLAVAPLLLRGHASAQLPPRAPGVPKAPGGSPIQERSPLRTATPFTVRFIGLTVTGGSKPGDAVTLKAKFEHAGGTGSKQIPWKIHADSTVVGEGTQQVTAGPTATFEASATWTAKGGEHAFWAEADPANTLQESSSARADNAGPTGRIKRVYADWPKWTDKAKDGGKSGVAMWIGGAHYTGGRIDGALLSGGRLAGPEVIGTMITAAMVQAGAPGSVAGDFGRAVQAAWVDWAGNIVVPPVPAYPSFTAVPASQAPPTKNVPFPLTAAPSARLAALTPGSLAATIGSRVGSAKEWPDGAAEIESFATWFAAAFSSWLTRAVVVNITGTGPVPTFAPPMVPVGAVVGGTASGVGVISGSFGP